MSSTIKPQSNIFFVVCLFISELLQVLENCENDPVAIAECFVSKVSRLVFWANSTDTGYRLFSSGG